MDHQEDQRIAKGSPDSTPFLWRGTGGRTLFFYTFIMIGTFCRFIYCSTGTLAHRDGEHSRVHTHSHTLSTRLRLYNWSKVRSGLPEAHLAQRGGNGVYIVSSTRNKDLKNERGAKYRRVGGYMKPYRAYMYGNKTGIFLAIEKHFKCGLWHPRAALPRSV